MVERARKYHTRSRTGCLACKKLHVRCDEQHPTCTRCENRGQSCSYPGLDVPLDLSRMAHRLLPGVHMPWIVPRLPGSKGSGADPFDALPIAMPMKSQELFRYFARVREEKGVSSALNDSLVLCTKDAEALRCVLLIAGLHFGNRASGLREFEFTYLHHKVECIQTVNELLNESQRSRDSSLIRLIATLCMVEANQGNVSGAEAHLDGLMTLLEMRRKTNDQHGLVDVCDLQDVLLQRYVLISIREVVDTKRRLVDSNLLTSVRSKPVRDPRLRRGTASGQWEENSRLVQDWLDALCLVPYYITATAHLTADIDARDVIHGMQVVTARCDDRYLPKTRRSAGFTHVSKFWLVDGGMRQSFLHAASNSSGSATAAGAGPGPAAIGDDESPSKFRTSMSSQAICNTFYMQSVLGLWGSQQVVSDRTMWWLVSIVQADLERTHAAMVFGTRSRELWFWKLFATAMCLEAVRRAAEQLGRMSRLTAGLATPAFQTLRPWFQEHIRQWSLVTGITTWKAAKEALSAIAWPESFPHEEMAKSVWETGLRGR